MSICKKLAEFNKNIPATCRLIAVSKTQPVERIRDAYECGQRLFGENRAQEAAGKQPDLPPDIEWHMIGHLQTNKVKYIAPFVSMIHSVDSMKLLQEINRQAGKSNRVIPCLLQVHIAEEESKFGFSPGEAEEFFKTAPWNELSHVRIEGLMGMATFTDNEDQVRREFRSLKELFTRLRDEALPEQALMKELSMGMSGDYRIAIEEGSTLVRIGTAIFGERLR